MDKWSVQKSTKGGDNWCIKTSDPRVCLSKQGVESNEVYVFQEEFYWDTKEEAQKFLDSWRLKQMDQAKIEQVKKDIQLLQEQLEELQKPQVKHGDIVDHNGEKKLIIKGRNGWLISLRQDGSIAATIKGAVENMVEYKGYKVIGNVFDN